MTALMEAAKSGNVECIKALINAKAKVNDQDNSGATALRYAENNDHDEAVAALRDAGAKDQTELRQ